MTPYHFFLKHGGYNYCAATETRAIGRRRCARESAWAEREAQRHGLAFVWGPDDDVDDSWMEPEERRQDHTWEYAQAVAPDGRVLASLYGIVDADATYRRVVEAELAAEALASVPHR